jgi:hypothetical protein
VGVMSWGGGGGMGAHLNIWVNYVGFGSGVRIISGHYRYRLSCSLGWELVKEYSVDF